jgi:hypothetical protein
MSKTRCVAPHGYSSATGNQIDFAEMLMAAVVALPGHLIEAYWANPGPWNLVGLMLARPVALKAVAGRVNRRRRRAR